MIFKCLNGRPLLISSIESIETELSDRWVPCVVLLTAWTIERVSVEFWDSLVRFLLDRGATYFVCIGDFSEHLHDKIDEIMYHYDDEHETEQSINIVTTFHANETIEDAIDYYVYGTELRDKKHGCLLALLDSDVNEDREVKALLEKT